MAVHCHRRAGGLWLRCRICRCDADGEQDGGERSDGACARAGAVHRGWRRRFGFGCGGLVGGSGTVGLG